MVVKVSTVVGGKSAVSAVQTVRDVDLIAEHAHFGQCEHAPVRRDGKVQERANLTAKQVVRHIRLQVRGIYAARIAEVTAPSRGPVGQDVLKSEIAETTQQRCAEAPLIHVDRLHKAVDLDVQEP